MKFDLNKDHSFNFKLRDSFKEIGVELHLSYIKRKKV